MSLWGLWGVRGFLRRRLLNDYCLKRVGIAYELGDRKLNWRVN